MRKEWRKKTLQEIKYNFCRYMTNDETVLQIAQS